MKPNNNTLIFMLFVVAVVATLFFRGNNQINIIEAEKIEKLNILSEKLNKTELIAKAVSVYDFTDNVKIYGKNDEFALPIASLAKIMTVVSGLEGRGLDSVVEISPKAIKQAGDFGIFANEKWKLSDLAKLTLVVSANDGAFALAENDPNFLSKINSKSIRLGANVVDFLNPTGLDIDANNAGVFASASDVNTMAMYAFKARPEIFEATTLPEFNVTSESGFAHTFKNTNVLIGKIPNLIFSKTGYTEIAGGNLAIMFKDKNEHIIAVTVLGSTFDGRFVDMEKIVNVLLF